MVQIVPFTPKSLSVNNLMKFKEHLVHISAKSGLDTNTYPFTTGK